MGRHGGFEENGSWQISCFLNLSSKDTCMLHHGTFHMLARHRICMIGHPLWRFVLSRCFPPLLQPFRLVGPQSEGRVSTEMRSSHTLLILTSTISGVKSVLQLAHKQTSSDVNLIGQHAQSCANCPRRVF